MVTGHHGGVEHVTIDFDRSTLRKITIDDKILIEGLGQGLKLLDFPEIKIYNLSTLLTSAEPRIKPVLNPGANLGKILKIGRYRARKQ